jgi:hypothetical protein
LTVLVACPAVTALVGAAAGLGPALAGRPGIRTLGSLRFKRVLGLLLLVTGLVFLLMLLQAVERAGGFEIDFVAAYRRASLDLMAGRSPYYAEQVSQAFPASGRYGWYMYPPAFAQVLTPLALLPSSVASVFWLLLQAAMLFAAAWIAGTAGGARHSLDRVLWTSVALLFFLPVHEVLWTGNMGGPLALSVAALLASRRSGGGERRPGMLAAALAGALAVFKLFPFAWLPAAFRAGGGLRRGTLLGVGGVLGASILLAPNAWLEYVKVLPNLLNGDPHYTNNLAPAIVAYNLGLPADLVAVVRIAALATAGWLVAASAWFARTERTWPLAVTCGVLAGLFLPATLWYHYLVVLFPLAAFVWVRADSRTRILLAASCGLSSAGMTMPLLAALGAAALVASILFAMRANTRDVAAEEVTTFGELDFALP